MQGKVTMHTGMCKQLPQKQVILTSARLKELPVFSCVLPGDLVPLHQGQREGVSACSLGGGGVPAGCRTSEETGPVTAILCLSGASQHAPDFRSLRLRQSPNRTVYFGKGWCLAGSSSDACLGLHSP